MDRLPHKVSLVTQTALVLTHQIKRGRWLETLPGEHALCAQLHVGRKTLRAALEQLQRDGLLQCDNGRRRKILRRSRIPSRRERNRVVLLIPSALHSLKPFVVFLVDRLKEHLAEEGCRLETHVTQAVYRSKVHSGLEDLSKTLHPAGWVLLHSTEPMQRWFAARQLPCVVAGSRFEGIKLSAVDVDYEALCIHAVNGFVSQGHKHLMLLNPNPAGAGDDRTEKSFMAATAQHDSIVGQITKHDGSAADICRQVEFALTRESHPTGILVSRAHHVLTVITFLLGRGVRIPEHLSLIARESDTYLESVVPEVARYFQDPNAFAANASRLVTRMIQGSSHIEDCKITPRFIRARTLGPLPHGLSL